MPIKIKHTEKWMKRDARQIKFNHGLSFFLINYKQLLSNQTVKNKCAALNIML